MDFAIWGPYGRRTLRARAFGARVLSDRGEYVPKQWKGPDSFAAWEASWDVFHVAMLMVGGATPAALSAYRRGIKKLVDRFGPPGVGRQLPCGRARSH